jgi:putative Holliday junction resolvase
MIIRNTKEFINIINDKKILSVDLGKKKVGLAISDTKHKITTPIKNILRNKFFHESIQKIILEYNVGAILVGLPLNNDKSLNKISQFIVDISKNMDLYLIENKINLPIFFWDENFSSFEAETLVRDFYKGKKIDKFAAKIFLDDFIRENTLLDEKKN